MYLTAKYFSYLVNIFPHVPKGKPEQYSAKQWFLCFLLKHIKPSFILNLTTLPFYSIQIIFRRNHATLYTVFWFSAWSGCTDSVLHWRRTRILYAVATWRVGGEQASSSRGQQGNLGWPVLCYRCYWSLKFRLPQKQEFWGVPPKQDMQISVIYIQSDNLSHGAFLISIIKVFLYLKKETLFPMPFLGTEIRKCFESKVLGYTWISYPTYSTFIFHQL